jgi:hypothetical protein
MRHWRILYYRRRISKAHFRFLARRHRRHEQWIARQYRRMIRWRKRHWAHVRHIRNLHRLHRLSNKVFTARIRASWTARHNFWQHWRAIHYRYWNRWITNDHRRRMRRFRSYLSRKKWNRKTYNRHVAFWRRHYRWEITHRRRWWNVRVRYHNGIKATVHARWARKISHKQYLARLQHWRIHYRAGHRRFRNTRHTYW